MKDVLITCDSCGRGWTTDGATSVYLQLDLSSRPCPHCEAYTLRCSERPRREEATRTGRWRLDRGSAWVT